MWDSCYQMDAENCDQYLYKGVGFDKEYWDCWNRNLDRWESNPLDDIHLPPLEPCDIWLTEAQSLLKTGGPLSQQAANLLEEYQREYNRWSCRTKSAGIGNIHPFLQLGHVITFDNPYPGTSAAPHGKRIVLSPIYLQDSIRTSEGGYSLEFKDDVCGLTHELRHTTQGTTERLSIRAEVEAYLFEAGVRDEFKLGNAGILQVLQRNTGIFGTADNVTTDVCTLCRARTCLVEHTSDSSARDVYSREPVYVGGGLPGLPTVYWPVLCDYCPDTSCP